MADSALQLEWITTIKGGLEAVFLDRPDVFVAGDLLWYAVEGEPTIRTAPDVLVVFGRPKGYRGSYQQWKEGGIPPQVVFEVASPGNRFAEMHRKFHFYEQHGVEEYYLYDPDHNFLDGWIREGAVLREIPETNGWVSPRLGVRLELDDTGFRLYGPDGRQSARYVELARQRNELQHERDTSPRSDEERRRAERLAARLRELGVDREAH